MKGFTLIEILIYMAISILIMTSLMGFAFLMLDSQKNITRTINAELAGNFWLKTLQFDPEKIISESDFIHTASSSLHTYSFSIDGHFFKVTYFQP
jgi:type II secretory pathway component PulJ